VFVSVVAGKDLPMLNDLQMKVAFTFVAWNLRVTQHHYIH
jgi:hypothetical protein